MIKYRPEIDGLRCVAVLPVILFHAGIGLFSGGYVGVDVFFVISGFLITGIIARELEQGDFSVINFYERRARRILPALFFVLGITTVAAVCILLPYELANYGKNQVGVILFVSNVLLWMDVNYFAGAAELNPLLHTWSLAVEEQFYIIFPLVLVILWRWRMAAVWTALVLGLIGSLMLADILSTRSQAANFYLLPTRAWELLIGALLALWVRRYKQPSGLVAEGLGLVGLAAIMLSVIIFDKATPFPSIYALLPVLGTAAVIVGATSTTLAGRILSLRPVVWIGLISYSAYLWHQPVFAFARTLNSTETPAAWLMLILGLVSLGLAWITWAFVEHPFRRRGRFSRRQIFSWSCLTGGMLACVGLALFQFQGLPQRYPESQRAWVVTGPQQYGNYVKTSYAMVENAKLSDDKPNLVIVGDSFSQDFYNVIRERGAFTDHAISAIYIPTRCQLHYGLPMAEFLTHAAREDKLLCARQKLDEQDIETIRRADVLIFAANWHLWSAERFPAMLTAMELSQKQRVLVIGGKRFEKHRRNLLAYNSENAPQIRLPVDLLTSEINAILAAGLPESSFVDIFGTVCKEGCPLFTSKAEIISYDGSHLTREGARFLGDSLFNTQPLADFDH